MVRIFFFYLNGESCLPQAKQKNVEWIWIKLFFFFLTFGILFKEIIVPWARAEAWKNVSQKVDAL